MAKGKKIELVAKDPLDFWFAQVSVIGFYQIYSLTYFVLGRDQ